MGVRGLLTYVTENKLFVEHRLQDTVLIIDGLNLENELYSRFLAGHDDKAFGGDYTHLAVYIEAFFKALLECGVTPVVIMNGTFEADKIKNKLERFDQRLKVAKAIYDGGNAGGEEINSLLNPYMFVQIIKRLKIAVYKSLFEADDIIPMIAADLNAPILSGDSDFLIKNLPAGMISVKDLLARDFKVVKDASTGQQYLPCEIYRLDSLQRCFPGLKTELVPLGGALLSNDCLDFNESKKILSKLPRPKFSHPKFRQFQIHTVFAWLASQQSASDVVAYIKRLCPNPKHRLIRCIEARLLEAAAAAVEPNVEDQTVEQYFEQNYDILFKREPGIPKWAHDRFVEEKMFKRLVSIHRAQVDFFRPLIEDFSLNESSYETIFELCEYIYGLLRSEDGIPKKVNRYVRVGGRREDQKVTPAVKVANQHLPSFSEISSLSQLDRITLFYQILSIDESLGVEIAKLTREALPKLADSTVNQLVTLLLSAIYMSRHFSVDLWIEFLYSLLANFLLMGHFTEEESIPKLLELDSEEHAKLLKAFQVFDKIPVRTRSYKARIVHQYNCFQNCLNNITFLAMILDLADVFNADLLVSGLQGTFIYNLALSLGSQTKPLSYLEDTLLGGPSFKYLPFFQQLLDLVLANSNRKFIATEGASTAGGDVVPKDVPLANAFENAQAKGLLVRGLEPKSALDNLAELGAEL